MSEGGGAPDEVEAKVDGRRARRSANRQAVVSALSELYGEGNLSPSTAEVAARAGLSSRSLFRYFDDVDDLVRAAIDQQIVRAQPLLRVDARSSDATAHKVERLVESRVRQFEVLAPAARAARVSAHRNRLVADRLVEARAFWREQVRRLFAPELAQMDEGAAARALAAIDVLCSFESIELLRHSHQLTADETAMVLVDALDAVLGSCRGR
jgi:AcrR family transcriptional regulator